MGAAAEGSEAGRGLEGRVMCGYCTGVNKRQDKVGSPGRVSESGSWTKDCD